MEIHANGPVMQGSDSRESFNPAQQQVDELREQVQGTESLKQRIGNLLRGIGNRGRNGIVVNTNEIGKDAKFVRGDQEPSKPVEKMSEL